MTSEGGRLPCTLGMYPRPMYSMYVCEPRKLPTEQGHVLIVGFFLNVPAKNLRAVHDIEDKIDTYRP